jgi:hypothetical protein
MAACSRCRSTEQPGRHSSGSSHGWPGQSRRERRLRPPARECLRGRCSFAWTPSEPPSRDDCDANGMHDGCITAYTSICAPTRQDDGRQSGRPARLLRGYARVRRRRRVVEISVTWNNKSSEGLSPDLAFSRIVRGPVDHPPGPPQSWGSTAVAGHRHPVQQLGLLGGADNRRR